MPPRREPTDLVPAQLDALIHTIRGQRVMLDSDLAVLYGVTTSALNQAVERNPDRFPDDFAFVMTRQEFTNLMSQIVTSSSGYGGRRKLPRVFTEQGVAMLSGVLRSPQAVAVNVEIMRTFVRLRQVLMSHAELASQLQALASTVRLHDEQIRAISALLQRFLTPPPTPPRRPIGFRPSDPPPDPAP